MQTVSYSLWYELVYNLRIFIHNSFKATGDGLPKQSQTFSFYKQEHEENKLEKENN